jgi:Tol biopolymer transport system component
MAASPDGSTLYHQKQGAPVVARDLKTGSERTLVEAGNATFDLKVSRDGRKLAVVAYGSLRIVDLATSQVQKLYQPADPNTSSNPAFLGGDWSADGQRLIVFARVDLGHRTELWTFPVNGGDPTKQRVAGDYRGVWISPDGKQLDTVQWEQLSQVWSLENFLPSAK